MNKLRTTRSSCSTWYNKKAVNGKDEVIVKQEHRLVADVYRYLAPFIDERKSIYLSLDGEAAKKGVEESLFVDSSIPDLCFTLVGSTAELRLEAKIVINAKVKLGRSQLDAWRSEGYGQHKPHAWVGADEQFKKFFYWSHQEFLEQLDKEDTVKTSKYVNVKAPIDISFTEVRALALHILRMEDRHCSD